MPLLAFCILIFASSSFSLRLISPPVIVSDIAHVAVYAVLSFLLARAIFRLGNPYPGRLKHIVLVSIVALCILYGLADELHQSFVPGRTACVSDLVADGLGSVFGVLFYSKTS